VLAKSVFIEKLHARGYEVSSVDYVTQYRLLTYGVQVLLMNEPLDEIREPPLLCAKRYAEWLSVVQNLRLYKTFPFQDVAKAGLKFGDEGEGIPT
jgi:heat shock protein beta